MSDEVDLLAQVIRNAALQGGVTYVNGVTLEAVTGGKVSVDIGGSTVTAFVPASIPAPLLEGSQVRLSVEGAVRTVESVLGGAAPVVGVPIGGIVMWAAAAAPAGGMWGICNGATFSAVTYPALAAVLGGTTLPDLRDRLPRGASTTAAVKSTGGSTTISVANMPSHSHSMVHTHTVSGMFYSGGTTFTPGGATYADNHTSDTLDTSGSSASTTGTAGTGTAYWQPYYAVNYIIRMA